MFTLTHTHKHTQKHSCDYVMFLLKEDNEKLRQRFFLFAAEKTNFYLNSFQLHHHPSLLPSLPSSTPLTVCLSCPSPLKSDRQEGPKVTKSRESGLDFYQEKQPFWHPSISAVCPRSTFLHPSIIHPPIYSLHFPPITLWVVELWRHKRKAVKRQDRKS